MASSVHSNVCTPCPTALSASDLPSLLTSDQSIWLSPLTLSTLSAWYRIAPLFSWKYLSSADVRGPQTQEELGVFFAVPLKEESFMRLCKGELLEWEISEGDVWFPSESKCDIGVHIFHLERTERARSLFAPMGFTQTCFLELQSRIANILGLGNVVGYSALVVTPEGERCFARRGWECVGEEVAFEEAKGEARTIRREEWKEDMGDKVGIGRLFVKMTKYDESINS